MAKNLQTSKKTGLIIGKFLPPHRGHQYLVDFARHYVDSLSVIVCSLDSEPISGKLRYQWMKELFPNVRIYHHSKKIPQDPSEHPDFWSMWKKSIQKLLPEGADYLFASEQYGWKLAEVLDMQYIPVDHKRSLIPISGTLIREDPMKYWNFIPHTVRPYFIKKVCIFGPESTGKSTLTMKLAKHYNTVYANEYARDLLDFKDGKCDYEDIERIAMGHFASEEALAKQANQVLFSDTDVITTVLWSNVLFKKCQQWIEDLSWKRNYDLYLLLDIDVPWVKDNQRYLPNQRKWFKNLCVDALEKRNKNYRLINGNFEIRFNKAVQAVDEILR